MKKILLHLIKRLILFPISIVLCVPIVCLLPWLIILEPLYWLVTYNRSYAKDVSDLIDYSLDL